MKDSVSNTPNRSRRWLKFHPMVALPLACLGMLLAIGWIRVEAAQEVDVPPVAEAADVGDADDPATRDTPAREPSPTEDRPPAPRTPAEDPAEDTAKAESVEGRQSIMSSLTIFILAVFVGFEVITKVPPMLHTPLMSGSNAISGITLVGALLVAGQGLSFAPFLGFVAVLLATINVVGGFLVTHRMLAMFKKR